MPNKKQYEKLKAAGLCATCSTRKVQEGHTACPRCKERQSVLDYERRWRGKVAVITAYGGCCAVCGISNIQYLTIDHIDNNGAEHRRKVMGDPKQAGWNFYRWLMNNNYPDGFQVLCYNHNASKENHPKICNEPYLWSK
jgi:hypothetical protein